LIDACFKAPAAAARPDGETSSSARLYTFQGCSMLCTEIH
jgi:hypothetical protein